MNQALQAVIAKYDFITCRVPQFVPSGISDLDAVTGGIPKGRIIDVYGGEDAGKSALALALAKGNTLLLDAECKLAPSMARCGLYVMHPETLEDALNICRMAAVGFNTVIVDSLEALPLKPEQERPLMDFFLEYGDEYKKTREQLLSKALPVLSMELLACGCTLIVVNQLLDRDGVIYGNPEYSTGGRALPYYASVRLLVSRIEYIMKRGQVTGQIVKVSVVKHRFGQCFGSAKLALDYHTGRLCSRKEALV